MLVFYIDHNCLFKIIADDFERVAYEWCERDCKSRPAEGKSYPAEEPVKEIYLMDLEALLSFTFIASLLVVSPGPNGVLIAKTVPTSGKAAGFANVAGFVAAFYVHGALSVLGISIILVQSAQAFFVVKMLGAAYLCWIGFNALKDAWNGPVPLQKVKPANKQRTLMKCFLEGFLTNGLNPKVSMFYLAVFPQFVSQTQGVMTTSFMLVFIHSMLNLIWFSAMVLLFSRLAKAARNDLFQRWLKGITGIVFIGSGTKLATLKPS